MVQSGIYFGCNASGSKFGCRLKWRRGCFTIFHVITMKKVTCILDWEREIPSLDWNTWRPRKLCKYHKSIISNFFVRLDFTWVKILVSKVINTKNKDYEIASYFLGVDIGVKMTPREVDVKKKAIHFLHSKLEEFV